MIGLLFILTRVIRFCLSGEKESRAASQFGHVLLTLAGLLCAGGGHFCTHPNTHPNTTYYVPQIHHQKIHIIVRLNIKPQFWGFLWSDIQGQPCIFLGINSPPLIKIQRSGSRSERLKLSDCPTYTSPIPHPAAWIAWRLNPVLAMLFPHHRFCHLYTWWISTMQTCLDCDPAARILGSTKTSSREQNHACVWEKMSELKLSVYYVYFQMMHSWVELNNGHITLTVENVISVLSLGFVMGKIHFLIWYIKLSFSCYLFCIFNNNCAQRHTSNNHNYNLNQCVLDIHLIILFHFVRTFQSCVWNFSFFAVTLTKLRCTLGSVALHFHRAILAYHLLIWNLFHFHPQGISEAILSKCTLDARFIPVNKNLW